MPELPEVETIVNDLNKKIKGETIADFWSDWGKGIKTPAETFKRGVREKKILGARRIGKNILLDLSGQKTVAVHLRMTGALIVRNKNAKPKHVHHVFYFKSGKSLEFSDIRKFGSLELADSGKILESGSLKKLGIDVLSKDFTLEKFDKILNGRKTNIKQLLMDQGKIAGLGNIYANEILFEAKISPLRAASSLGRNERKKIFQAISKIIKYAIKMRGTSVSDYRDASGEKGGFQRMLKVYGKASKKCPGCDTIISRKVVGQRSTFYCKKCQL